MPPSRLRRCCRHPQASTESLPNVRPVASPTQDEDYDADAVSIPTPTPTLVGRHQPSILAKESAPPVETISHVSTPPAEPRPSSDTVVHHEMIQRSGHRFAENDSDSAEETDGKTLRVQRLSSITVPRQRSTNPSQPLPSPSTAAGDQYVKISPSRVALRKRLKSIELFDAPSSPPLPKLEPARVASIPESALSPQWRLSYKQNSASFRRPGLKELSVNERQQNASGGSSTPSTSSRAQIWSGTERENVIDGTLASSELGDHPTKGRAPSTSTREYYNPGQSTATKVEKHQPIPGSYGSESTASSVHLYDMHISERVASSNSNVVSSVGASIQSRQRASTTGSGPAPPMGMSWYHRDRQSSSLQSPQPASSIYSSNEEDLASSRRSSVRLIEGLPERIKRLKTHVTTGDLYGSSAQHSQITVIPRSRFTTTLSDESQYMEASGSSGSYFTSDEDEPQLKRVQSLPLRRSSTEPRLNRFKRGDPASFDGSGEWHLSPPAPPVRTYTGLSPPGPPVRTYTGRALSRQPTGFLDPEDMDSAWEKALREHAAEDRAILKSRMGSISYEIGRDDFKRRARSRRFTRTPSPLGDITEDPWSQVRGLRVGPASGRVSPLQDESTEKRVVSTSPVDPASGRGLGRVDSSSSHSVKSWTRYPSHTYTQRTDAANTQNQIITRDFAPSPSPNRRMSKKKSRSMTFGRKIKYKLGQFYKTRTSDARRFQQGHRSSISVGGVLQFPELEIPRMGAVEPVLLSGPRDESEGNEVEEVTEAAKTPLPESPKGKGKGKGAVREEDELIVEKKGRPRLDKVDWSGMYESCVVRPRYDEDEEIAPDEVVPVEEDSGRDGKVESGDEKAEIDAEERREVERAKEEALRAADECLRRSGEIDRFLMNVKGG
ncbi:MAG: hypothetical protein Q9174_000472 [Haloplaca sp. 1 TL-2023]